MGACRHDGGGGNAALARMRLCKPSDPDVAQGRPVPCAAGKRTVGASRGAEASPAGAPNGDAAPAHPPHLVWSTKRGKMFIVISSWIMSFAA